MKFTKLSQIRRHRIFRNFTWGAALPELSRYNVLYGWNGSGKTTLSNIFEAIERNATLDSGECECVFEGGSIRGSEFSSDRVRPSVKVFNRSYVESTVFRSGAPGVPPIYFVAKGGAEKQQRVEDIGVELRGADGKSGLDGEFTAADKAVARAEADFDSFNIERATEIRNELRSAGENPYNNYDKRGFRAAAERLIHLGSEAIAAAKLGEKAFRELRQKKNAVLLGKVELGELPVVDVSVLSGMTERVIGKTVVSTAIDALAENASVEQWVRSGLHLHGIQRGEEHARSCLFCEQALTSDRVAQLEAHFNDNYQSFINELDDVLVRIDKAAYRLARPELPKAHEMAEHLREAYVDARENLETIYADQRTHLRWLRDAISDKSKMPFKPLVLSSYVKEEGRGKDDPGPHIAELKRLIDEHNHGISTFEQSVSSARVAIEGGIVARVLEDYIAKKNAPGELKRIADGIKEKRRLLADESAGLERDIRQHSVPADELNAELRSYLGRDELKFTVQGAGYTIDRGGVQATNLSEGEKTAIAFLYFLKSLKGTDFDLANSVVVIDDPVSSLDANSLFSSFAYLSKRTIEAGQLIILTHNFLFLKQIKNWFEYLPKNQVRHYMVESYMEVGGRSARISKMDKLLREHQSEYHYLFRLVVQGSRMNQGLPLENYYGHPNMARRLLEIFLGFRFPAKSSFHKRIESLKSDAVVIARIRRFVHTYSHEEGDGEDFDATMLAESPAVLAAILDVIQAEDSGHFAEMQALVAAAEAEDAA